MEMVEKMIVMGCFGEGGGVSEGVVKMEWELLESERRSRLWSEWVAHWPREARLLLLLPLVEGKVKKMEKENERGRKRD